MVRKIRVLIIDADKEPKQVKIEHTLKNFQNIVGRLIEVIALEHNVGENE